MTDNIHPIFDQLVTRRERELQLGQKSKVLWMTGLSGSGKSTIAKGLERKLFENGYFAQVLDGDNVRAGICNNLGFSIEDRTENIRRIAEVAKLYVQSGIICICSFISPTRSIREMASQIINKEDFLEIYINASIEACEERDVKGLYAKVRKGEIKGFTGIDAPYEEPIYPFSKIDTEISGITESVDNIYTSILPEIMLK
jgi:adenylylsulfate kinase